MLDRLAKALLQALIIPLVLGTPITFIINVVHTWQGKASVPVKLLINLTLDAFLAAIWPITWCLWLVYELSGWQKTPLSTVLGLF
jgi:hypothetical protein